MRKSRGKKTSWQSQPHLICRAYCNCCGMTVSYISHKCKICPGFTLRPYRFSKVSPDHLLTIKNIFLFFRPHRNGPLLYSDLFLRRLLLQRQQTLTRLFIEIHSLVAADKFSMLLWCCMLLLYFKMQCNLLAADLATHKTASSSWMGGAELSWSRCLGSSALFLWLQTTVPWDLTHAT